MLASSIPTKIPVPFAAQAGPSFIRTIPESTSTPGAASWEAGFPPDTAEPIGSGGIPPDIRDFNGLYNAISAWQQWQGAGGPVSFDAAFAAALTPPGYPMGATLVALNNLGWYVSTENNNSNNPDTGGANWLFIPIEQTYAGNPNGHVSGQVASGISPPSTVLDTVNGVFWECVTSGNAGTAVWTPLSILIPVQPDVTGNSKNYNASNIGSLVCRTNGGANMSDSLPSLGTVTNGWWLPIKNIDPSASLTITAPTGTALEGVSGGHITLLKNQSCIIVADASGNYWIETAPVPSSFSAEAIYVAASGTYLPGFYDIDTTGGPIDFTLTATPTLGDNYFFRDIYGTFGSNNCNVLPNGNTADVGVLDVNWSECVLTFKSGNWSLV